MSQVFYDFIRPGEEELYAELDRSLRAELAPAGILENTLVDEIRIATWRLHRCAIVEAELADFRVIRKALDEQFPADYHRQKFTGIAEINALLSTRLPKIPKPG